MSLSYVPVLKAGGDVTFKDLTADNISATNFITPGQVEASTVLVQPGGTINFGASSDVNLYRSGANLLATDDGLNVGMNLHTFGSMQCDSTVQATGLKVVEGANAAMGVATLVTGSVTVNTTKVTANSRIFLTVQTLGTVTSPKAVCAFNRTPGTSFQIASSDATDTSVVAWMIVEPS